LGLESAAMSDPASKVNALHRTCVFIEEPFIGVSPSLTDLDVIRARGGK